MLLNEQLQIFLIICSVIFFLIVLNYSVKRKIGLRYSVLWVALSIVFIALSIFPNLANWFSSLVGIREPIHFILLIVIAFVLLVLFTCNNTITKLVKENRMLIQEMGILKHRINDLEKDNEEK